MAPRKRPRPPAPADLARRGKLTTLARLPSAREAYRWLCAADDFGHDDVAEAISDLLETSSLRFDDGRFETAAAHWELAVAYLEGAEGLPRDLALAAKHLERAFESHATLEALNAGLTTPYSSEAVLARLADDAQSVLRDGLSGNAFNRAFRQLSDLRRLSQLPQVPAVIVNDARRALRRTVQLLCPLPEPSSVGGSEPLEEEVALLEETVKDAERALAQLRSTRRRKAPP